MCRRPVGGPDCLVAIFDHLDHVLPATCRLHGFDIKGTALARLRGLEHRIRSLDSQAFGIASLVEALRLGTSKTNSFVVDHMERWVRRQHERAAQAAIAVQGDLPLVPRDDPPEDRWERAVIQARSEMRELVELGELDHGEITIGWIEQWAADIYAAG